MKSLGFKKTLIISILLLVTASLLTSNWLSYNNLKDSTVQSIKDKSVSTARFEAKIIEDWFHTKILAIDSLANHYKLGTYGDRYVDITRFTKSASDLTSVYFGFDDGSTYSSLTGDRWINGVANKDKYDPRVRPWYQLAKRTNNLDITDVYNDTKTGEPVVSIVKNIGNGVVKGDVFLSILDDAVENINFPGAITIILDGAGKTLATNSTALDVGGRLSDIGMVDVQNAMLSQDDIYIDYTLNGVEKLAITKSIKLVNGKKWYLFIGVDKSVVYATVDEALTNALITSLVMISIVVLLVLTMLNTLYRPILSLKDVVLDLSKGNGDLTRRLPVTSDDDLGQISEGINVFIGNLQSLMLDVSQSSELISHSVDKLKHQTDENNEVLTAHSAETEQIVAAIEEMNATANDVASNASEASQFTHNANTQVTDSKNVVMSATKTVSELVEEVENTSVSIAEIGNDTKDITNVLKVIGEIAEQTNLLALNAAIEAARAGEQGRGFAVVADEVRALAARTQTSTAEIEQTLSKLHAGSTTAITAMDSTKLTGERTVETTSLVAQNLDSIAKSVIHINDLNMQIATAAEEQSSVTDEITRNMTAIRGIVGELSANGEATTNETINLAAANSQLKSIVSKFRLQ